MVIHKMANIQRDHEMSKYTFGISIEYPNQILIREKINKGFKYHLINYENSNDCQTFLRNFEKSTMKSSYIDGLTVSIWNKPKNVTWVDIEIAQLLFTC